MIKILQKPYPCNKGIIDNLILSIIIGAFIFFFLLLFHPFDQLINYTLTIIIGYSLITAVVSFFIAAIIPLLFNRYFEDKVWTVGKEILHLSFIVFVIGAINFFYTAYHTVPEKGKEVYSFYNFILSITITFIIGVMPIIIVILYNQTRLLKKYIAASEKINTTKHKIRSSKNKIVLNGEGKNEVLTLDNESVLFIKSESNYCEVYLNESENHQKKLLRGSLASIEKMLSDFDPFVRVHRSYIVNLNNIEKVSGTAQGYKLHFLGVESTVPVSRNKSTYFKSLIS